MRIHAPVVRERGRDTRLTATVELDGGERQEWFVEVGAPYGDVLDTSADCFVPAAALVAAAHGEDLDVDAEVSGRLLEGTSRGVGMMCDWWGGRSPTIVAASVRANGPRTGTHVGLSFSRGVDSTSTLLRGWAGELPASTLLLTYDQYEPALSAKHNSEVWRDHESAAADWGLDIVRLRGNVRAAVQPYLPWEQAYGLVTISGAQILGPMLRSILFSSSSAARRPGTYGAHPDLDPCWATETTEVLAVGLDQNRFEKTAVLGWDQRALDWLKVCWKGDTRWNCGRCTKCLYTMCSLAALGLLDRCPRFDAPLTREAVEAAEPEPSVALHEVLVALRQAAPELASWWGGYVPADDDG